MGMELSRYGGDADRRENRKNKRRIEKNEKKRSQSQDDPSSQSSEDYGNPIRSKNTISISISPFDEDKCNEKSRCSKLWMERENWSESLDNGRIKILDGRENAPQTLLKPPPPQAILATDAPGAD
jgi:hypothetical protein